ncbi:hypothetical protein J4864_01535 [Prevotella multiformis]|uniref:hypothetical protein n=1 Tax=Prevotella multiformis TaxID=282402 RepID=UPI001BAB2EA9|nr:hypothetical protein [Prevotella multiformis]QUB70937.1 hypothetical protein J4864_01535 [Prevotella multiformis]
MTRTVTNSRHDWWRASTQLVTNANTAGGGHLYNGREREEEGVPVTLIPVAEGDRQLVQEKFTVTARDTGVLPRLSGTCPCSFCRTDTRGAS